MNIQRRFVGGTSLVSSQPRVRRSSRGWRIRVPGAKLCMLVLSRFPGIPNKLCSEEYLPWTKTLAILDGRHFLIKMPMLALTDKFDASVVVGENNDFTFVGYSLRCTSSIAIRNTFYYRFLVLFFPIEATLALLPSRSNLFEAQSLYGSQKQTVFSIRFDEAQIKPSPPWQYSYSNVVIDMSAGKPLLAYTMLVNSLVVPGR